MSVFIVSPSGEIYTGDGQEPKPHGAPEPGPWIYRSRPTSGRYRRTAAEMDRLRGDLIRIVKAESPMTVRQVFYQAVTRGLIEKTETEYKQTIVRLLAELRWRGLIDWDDIVDGTRLMRKPRTYSGVDDALRRTAQFYRRAVFDDLDVYIEVWLEKEALSRRTLRCDRRVRCASHGQPGYSSLPFLRGAAREIEAASEHGKDVFLYNFGDHDPSGVDIARQIKEDIAKFTNAPFTFERIAVTPEQIRSMNLPTRPTKLSDTRATHFDGESVEVDAISPSDLRDLCRDAIEQHIPNGHMETLRAAEQSERELLGGFAGMAKRR